MVRGEMVPIPEAPLRYAHNSHGDGDQVLGTLWMDSPSSTPETDSTDQPGLPSLLCLICLVRDSYGWPPSAQGIGRTLECLSTSTKAATLDEVGRRADTTAHHVR